VYCIVFYCNVNRYLFSASHCKPNRSVFSASQLQLRLKAREIQGKGKRENRGTKRRRKAISERRTNRCTGPGFPVLAIIVSTRK